MNVWAWGALVGYISTIFLANWAIVRLGPVPVGFGLEAPAGVYFVGLAFTFRDLVQDGLGRGWTVVAILVGAALSALIATPQLALASGAAFLVSETADFAVYTPLRGRTGARPGRGGRPSAPTVGAVFASNVVGLVVDSALFLSLAFGNLDFLPGQVVGKGWMTLVAVGLLWAWSA